MTYPVTARFHPLDNMVANGMTHFKRARDGWISGKYDDMAINPFSLRAVKFLDERQFIYIYPTPKNEDMPVIRVNRQQLVTFPFDELTQLRFANWFYDCLRTGVRKPFYETYEPMIVDRANPTKQKKPVPEPKPKTQPPCAPEFYELERTKTIAAVGRAKRVLAQQANSKKNSQEQQHSAPNPTKITNRVGMGSFGGFRATGRRQTQTRKTKRAVLRDLKTGDYLAEDLDSDYYYLSGSESGADFGDVCTGADFGDVCTGSYSACESETESDLSDFIVSDSFVEYESDY